MRVKGLTASTKGLLTGIVLGVAIALVFAVQAAWSDPTQAPPNGGGLKVNTTGAISSQACASSNAGALHYDDVTGNLYVCDGTSTTWDQLTN